MPAYMCPGCKKAQVKESGTYCHACADKPIGLEDDGEVFNEVMKSSGAEIDEGCASGAPRRTVDLPDPWKKFQPGVCFRDRQTPDRTGRVVGWNGRFILIRWGGKKTEEYIAEILLPKVEVISRHLARNPMANPTVHLVMRWHYNDARYCGICSKRVIAENRKNSQSWCSQSHCWDYHPKGSTDPLYKLDEGDDWPCNESMLFSDYRFSTGGSWLAESRDKAAGKDLTISKENQKLLRGKLAFMTTRELDSEEKDRYVFGLIQIAGMENAEMGDFETTRIHGIRKTSLLFDEAVRLPFWKFYQNRRQGEKWSQGLYRYLSGPRTIRALEMAMHEYQKLPPTEVRRKHLSILEIHLSTVRGSGDISR